MPRARAAAEVGGAEAGEKLFRWDFPIAVRGGEEVTELEEEVIEAVVEGDSEMAEGGEEESEEEGLARVLIFEPRRFQRETPDSRGFSGEAMSRL